MASQVFITKMNDSFILVNNANGCELQFVTDVPEKYKTVQIDGMCKEELIEMIEAYKAGALMQDAFTKREGNVIVKMLPDEIRELIVHGHLMVEMFNCMEDGDEE